jgi:hypothetical protein
MKTLVAIAWMSITAVAGSGWSTDSAIDHLKAETTEQSVFVELSSATLTTTLPGLAVPCDMSTASSTRVAQRCKNTCDCSPGQSCCPTANGYCGCFPFRCPS